MIRPRQMRIVESQRPGVDGNITKAEAGQLRYDAAAAASGVTALQSTTDTLAAGQVGIRDQVAALAADLGKVPAAQVPMPSIPNLLLHLDATTIAAASQSRLASWPGLVGGRNAVRANVDTQPLYEKGVMAGRPGVTFSNARNDSMEVTGLGAAGVNGTIVAVVKASPTPSGARFIFDTDNARKAASLQNGPVTGPIVQAATVNGGLNAPTVLPATSIIVARFNGVSSWVRVNGVQTSDTITELQVTPPAIALIGHRQSLAAGQGFDGSIGEIMYIDRPISADEAAALELYLSAKWGVPMAGQSIWYVDTVAGNDANTGRTASTAYATWPQVQAGIRAAKQANPTVYINAPETTPLRVPTGTGVIKDDGGVLRLLPMYPGVRWHMRGTVTIAGGWTSVGGGVFSRPFTVSGVVTPIAIVDTLLDEHGQPTRILTRAAVDTAPAPGEYGFAGGTYYINLPGGANPNTHRIDIVIVTVLIRAQDGSTVLIHNGHLRGGQNHVVVALDNGHVEAIDSIAELALTGAWSTAGLSNGVRALRCVGRYSGNDGFNHHATAGHVARMELIDCEGAWNADEGVSPHDDTILILRGGHFHHNGSGGLTSVGRALTFIDGTEFSRNRRTTSGSGWDVGGVAILEQAKLVSLDLHSRDHPGPGVEIDTAAGATWIDNGGTRSGTAAGNGTLDVV